MNHLSYVGFFEGAAKKHVEIAHDQPLPNSQDKRQSFFRINNEEEMQTNLMNSGSFPALSLLMYQGKLNAKDKGLVREALYGGFDVRYHVDNIGDYNEIETARSDAKKVCEEIIALMLEESEKVCSIFKSLDIDSIRYQFIGPINTHEYGCMYFFNLRSNADTINNTDISTVFSL